MRASWLQSNLFKPSKKHLFDLGKKLVLPNDLGFVIKLSDDKEENESISNYRKKCVKEICQLIKKNPDKVSILVTGAALGVKQDSIDATMKMVNETRRLLFSGQPITAEMEDNAYWGHISLYHPSDEIIVSHSGISPENPVSFNTYLKRDVKTAVDEPSDARYFAQLSSSLFLTNEHTKPKKEDYELMENNCAVAVRKWAELPVGSVGNNPLETFHRVLIDIVLLKIDEYSRKEISDEIINFGIARDVYTVSMQEAKRREQLKLENIPTPGFKK